MERNSEEDDAKGLKKNVRLRSEFLNLFQDFPFSGRNNLLTPKINMPLTSWGEGAAGRVSQAG